ncbi:MAG TPA: ABC transporter permease subunit [Verrucomicrobiae bacterium]|jgi:ABC-2 type transport system permease protein|nr:ABC transporter permease subunit [Verrucomicrobiae bacterium]
MQAYLTITRRELAGFFFSLTGYVIIAATAFLLGLSFNALLINLGSDPTPIPLTELFYDTFYFWLILLLTVPVITMRLFALEKFSGTFETLMTTPVSDVAVVAAKFTAALIFFMLMWLPLLACILVVRHFTLDASAFDIGTIGSTFLGILLLGSLFLSLGCFASALTRSQVTAAMISLMLSVGLFVFSFLADRVPKNDWKSQVISFFGLQNQMRDFVRGVVDTRPVVFCLSVTLVFLFLTLRVIESRRWK